MVCTTVKVMPLYSMGRMAGICTLNEPIQGRRGLRRRQPADGGVADAVVLTLIESTTDQGN
jgi:hypothetical protein